MSFVFVEPINDYCHLEARSDILFGSEDEDYQKGLYKEVKFEIYRVSKDSGSENKIGETWLAPMPGCCGVVISYFTHLENTWQHTGMSNPFRKLKENLAKHFGYSIIIATTRADNVPACGNFIKSKYKVVKTFQNKRTNHLLWFGIKEI